MEIITRAAASAAGLKRYFTGEPCLHGHVAERNVSGYGCIECARLRARDPKLRASRMEYMREHQRQYRKKHPDRIKATRDRQDKSRLAAYQRSIRAKDPEKYRAALRRAFQKHKAKRQSEMKVWRANNKEANSKYQRVAKAKRRAAEGAFTRADIERMLVAQNFVCLACPSDISAKYHIDHIVPLARGGTNWPDNLQLLCGLCNQSKGAKTMSEWLAWREIYQNIRASG